MLNGAMVLKVFCAIPFLIGTADAATRIKAWGLPKQYDAASLNKEGWKAIEPEKNGGGSLALENRKLIAVAIPGKSGVFVFTKSKEKQTRIELRILSNGNKSSIIKGASISKPDGNSGLLKVIGEGTEAQIKFTAGQIYFEVLPGEGADILEVRSQSMYAVLPDFFADDTVYDPQKFSGDATTVPAENFLLQFVEGKRAIVSTIWKGSLGGNDKKSSNGHAKKDPAARVLFGGEAEERRVIGSSVEFLKQSIFVSIQEHEKIWHEVDVSTWTAYKPKTVEWARPFDAQWRADFLVSEGKNSEDWHTRIQSFNFRGPVKDGEKPWWGKKGSTPERPMIWEESLGRIVYPCWFNGDETRICLYADSKKRKICEKANKKKGKKADPDSLQYPENIYQRVLFYPMDRVTETPLTVFTLTDIMRNTLGEGPCEYVLDLEGIKPRPDGGTRPLLENATCPLWDKHIFPIVSRDIGKTGGKKLPDDKKKHLINAMEDMSTFVKAVHDRLREYKKWGRETEAFLTEEGKKSEKVKPLADKLLTYVKSLNKDVGSLKFEGKGTEGYWIKRVTELIEQINQDNYKEVGSVKGIRNLGNRQDQMVARCRRYVKGLRQEVSLSDVSDPEIRTFTDQIRKKTQEILRNKHDKEGL